jgi:4-amino-4-deoxy-L-arabinose transferase-like glycosyltransferase
MDQVESQFILPIDDRGKVVHSKPTQLPDKSGLIRSIVRKLDLWAIVAAVAFLAVNVGNVSQYGLSFDEPAGMERGRQTIALVKSFFTSGISNARLDDGVHNHPSFYATCNYMLSNLLVNLVGTDSIAAGHVLNVLTASIGLVILFYLGKWMFNPRVGLVAMLFMIFFPRFVAHSHYNAKDMPVMVFASLTLLLLYIAAKKGQTRYFALAGISFAVCVTSKLDGLFLVPIFLIPWMLFASGPGFQNGRSRFNSIGVFSYAAVISIVLLWPALWIDPIHLLRSVSNFAGEFNRFSLRYLGTSYANNALPWHYMSMHLLATTPLISLVFLVLGAVCSIRHIRHGHARFEHSLLWCLLLIPLLARMKPGTLQYDGMRHVFLVVPAMALLAGIGVDQLHQFWQRHSANRASLFVSLAFGGAVFGWSSWQVIQSHPYQGSYLNEGVRMLIKGPELRKSFDFASWGTPLKAGVDWLNANASTGAVVSVPNHLPTLHHYPLRPDLRFQKAEGGNFSVVMGWRGDLVQRFSNSVFSVKCYGSDLLLIYSHRAQ